MRRSKLPSSLDHLLIILALFSPLIAGQSVYAVEQQAHVWNTPDEQVHFSGVVPANLSFQVSQDQVPIPTATLTPTSAANIRNLPATKGTDIIGQAAKGSQYTALGFVTRDDGQWYFLSLPDGGYGWVRSDGVPAPVGDDLWDLSDVAALPLSTDEAKPGDQLLDLNINLAIVKSAFDTLTRRGVPTETFTAANIELIGILGQNLIFRLKHAVQANAAGTVLTVIEDDNGLQGIELFSLDQLRDTISKNGIQAEGEFSVAHSADQYLRFGSTVLFNYVQATSRLTQGKDREEALLSSVIVSDTAFPDTLFSISATDARKQILFTEGQAYDLLQKEGEGFLRAKKLDITVMTPFVIAAQINLPEGTYTFDTNPEHAVYGRNKMLVDASGNVVAVSNVEGDVWQTAETIASSMNLDTNAEDGSKLKYIFWGDQGNMFVREQRDNDHTRGVQAILNEQDGTWHNLRDPFNQIEANPHMRFFGTIKDRQNIIMTVVSAGERVGLELPIPGTDAVATRLIRVYYFHLNGRAHDVRDDSMETALVVSYGRYHDYDFEFMDDVHDREFTPGMSVFGVFPIVPAGANPYPQWATDPNEILREKANLFIEYNQNNQDTLQHLINGDVVNAPIFMQLRANDPVVEIVFP